MCDNYCSYYFDPVSEKYEEIGCSFCKKHIKKICFEGQLHKIRFLCDISHKPEQFMRIVYRYRNWYGENREYIYFSEKNPHYDFMKLCVDSNEIKQPVIYETMGCYNGLSENGNPIWIIMGEIKFIEKLLPYNRKKCIFKDDYNCNHCNICHDNY